MRTTITYAVDLDTGRAWSRVEGHPTAGDLKVAVAVLDYERIGEGGSFSGPLTYNLEAMDVSALIHARLRWTRKVPLEAKNLHRRFWGMPLLKLRGKEA
jgi:hypothetical protein